MSIRAADAFRLWARSAGRCSVCRIELTATALDGTAGEMAHIVARSETGPRGEVGLPVEDRDRYANLILLCPNHHTEVDRDLEHWTVGILRETKHSHEKWVAESIENGTIRPLRGSTEDFIRRRTAYWSDREPASWLYLSLAPLSVEDEVWDPVSQVVRDRLAALRLPEPLQRTLPISPNPYHVNPTAGGLAVEEFDDLASEGDGYRLELFRNGSQELVVSLKYMIFAATAWARESVLIRRDPRLGEPCLAWSDLAPLADWSIRSLLSLWSRCELPFSGAVLTVAVMSKVPLYLLLDRLALGPTAVVGQLQHSVVVDRAMEGAEAGLQAMGRIVNGFGLVLDRFLLEGGGYATPRRL